MVWFARWRPRFRKVAICAAIIATLASTGVGVQKLRHYNQANTAYSEIIKFDEVRKSTLASLEEVNKLLIEAAEMKALADRLLKVGKTHEAKQEYQDLLKKYKQIIETLTVPDESGFQIALAKNRIIRIKERLKDNEFFNQNRADVARLERDVYIVWVEVDRLTKLVSKDFRNVERMLSTLK